MILQALKEYYDRKAADPATEIAPPGWEWKEILFIIQLHKDGTLANLDSTTEGSGKSKRAKKFLVPQGVKKTSGNVANLLWDNPEYTLGIEIKGSKEKVKERHELFKERIAQLGNINDSGLDAVKKFLEQTDKKIVLEEKNAESFQELLESGSNLTFKIAGENDIVCRTPAVITAIQNQNNNASGTTSTCLVSGEKDLIERLHTAIKGVWGAQSSGANIVSFNADAFGSFNKKQGSNSPVGKNAVFAYTTALNNLLGKDSTQRIQIGDASTVFWSQKRTDFEKEFSSFFSEPPKDDPDRNTRAIKSLMQSPDVGSIISSDEQNKFFVLGLAPNASRISIRFWIVDTVTGMSKKILQHFEDLYIAHGPREHDAIPLFRLLVSTAVQGKSDNIPPNLAGDTMRAILGGGLYPQTLLQGVIRRIRAEHEVTYPRAALIKACLNRSNRLNNSNQEGELTVSLDLNNMNAGYRLGRLFATLEKIQEEANPGINATIRDRFYGAASGAPVTVFGNLMRLKNHHLAKLDSPGRRINFEKLIGEIMSGIDDFPSHLPLAEQGRFAVGYYHQKQDFFTKKADKE